MTRSKFTISQHDRRSRSGLLMLELVVSALLIGVLISMLSQGITLVSRQQKKQSFHALARIELNNLERTATADFGKWTLSESFRRRFPDAKLQVEAITEQQSGLPFGPAVKASLAQLQNNGTAQQVQLVLWPRSARNEQ